MAVKNILTRNPITIDKDQRLKDALRCMTKEKISRLLVTDEGEIVGIITEEDVAKRLGKAKDLGTERKLMASAFHVSSAMMKELITVSLETSEADAAKVMLEHGFSSVPVTDGSRIVGLVTKTDLIRGLVNSKKEAVNFYTKDPITTSPGASLVSAREKMLKHNVHRLVVTNRGMIAGILTERDVAYGLSVFRKALDSKIQADVRGMRVEHVMAHDPVVIKPGTPVGKAVKIMLEKNISGLVVVGEFGILTKTDLVRGISDGELP